MPAAERHLERIDLPIVGMSCAGCAASIESRLAKAPGVASARVNFATGTATVEYDPGETGVPRLVRAVEQAGYRVPKANEEGALSREQEREYRLLQRRFRVAVAFGLPLFVLGMSHGVFHVPGMNRIDLRMGRAANRLGEPVLENTAGKRHDAKQVLHADAIAGVLTNKADRLCEVAVLDQSSMEIAKCRQDW